MLCPICGQPSGEASVVCSKHRIVFYDSYGKPTGVLDGCVPPSEGVRTPLKAHTKELYTPVFRK